MKVKTFLIMVVLLSVVAFSSVFAQTYNYEEMTQLQYNEYLQDWQTRLEAAQQGIADEDAKIAELNKEMESLQSDIDGSWNDIFTATSKQKADYDSYGSGLNQLQNDARAFQNLSPEEIYQRMNELDELKGRLDEAKKDPFSAMSENAQVVRNIESLLAQAEEKGKAAVPPSYTVVKGDYLWKIAAKDDIYGDAYAWTRIYTSNRDLIKDPNLIFPNQVFQIPRQVGPNEHLVVRGEFLSKIAGYSNVYGSPFKWQKLYEANKDFITDPNLIYPYQVLKIAR